MTVNFYLYFPDPDDAQRAAEQLRREGYAVQVRPGADADWLTLGSRDLDEEELDDVEARMDALAESLNGDFDGFERAVKS